MLSQLGKIVGEEYVLSSESDLAYYGTDRTRFAVPAPLAVIKPKDVDQIQQVIALARQNGIALVPSGGRTGLSGGACAVNGELVVSFDRMNRIKTFSQTDQSVTVEAGVVTSQLQAFAREQGLYYPVDFASSGSSQIGGNIATNAGGIRVLRYGMTRDQVSGLKVVTGAGQVMDLNQGLVKNNTGYDLRHLFIGSEGTLGFIVEATMQLVSTPQPATVVLLAVPAMAHCMNVLQRFREHVTLNAFEFFSHNALEYVLADSNLDVPFKQSSDFYVLLEFEESGGQDQEQASTAFDECCEAGFVTDGIIGTSEAQNRSLWQYRERISESIAVKTPYKNDIAVTVSQVPVLLSRVDEIVRAGYPAFEIVWFGHIGDGNLHLNILKPDSMMADAFKQECEKVSEQVLSVVGELGGSVSAEHGIGLLKKAQLHHTRSGDEIAAMAAIKQAFDPDNIMNPGKLLEIS